MNKLDKKPTWMIKASMESVMALGFSPENVNK